MVNLKYLPLVIEEAAAVISAAGKVQRFGSDVRYPGTNPTKTNIEVLALEVGDLLEVLAHLNLPLDTVMRGRNLLKWGLQVTKDQLDAQVQELKEDA